jgi:hypothetical protein
MLQWPFSAPSSKAPLHPIAKRGDDDVAKLRAILRSSIVSTVHRGDGRENTGMVWVIELLWARPKQGQ